jgi:threonine/homoserine/homoserine lactone efflux protein
MVNFLSAFSFQGAVGAAKNKLRSGNPKAILLFTAFLPQFVDPARPVPAQFAVLGTLFLLLEWIAISAYAWMGLHMRRWLAEPRGKRIFNRCCAGLLSAAASVLLLAKRA